MVRLGDLELSPIDGHTFRAPWLCRLHEARDYGDRHQYCPLGLTSFGMRSRPVRCSPCTAQVNSVDRPAPALSTAKSSPVLNSARQSGCSSVGRCTTCPRFGRLMDWPPLLSAEMHIVGNCPTVGANSPMNEKKPPGFKAVPRGRKLHEVNNVGVLEADNQ